MKTTYDYDLVCIGSGPAGQRAAIVEKPRCLGGMCLGTGTIPSKTLREAVLFFSRIASRHHGTPAAQTDGRPTTQQFLAKVDEVLAR